MQPVFSVIIPAYNRQHLIGRAINSVQQQTFQQFEILVIDDASTDDTRNVVKSLNDDRIIYERNPVNSGAAFSRNRGIALARGKYISFLDSDDYYLPEFLAMTLREISSTAEEVGFMWTGYQVVDGAGLERYRFAWKPPKDNRGYYHFLKELRIGTGCGLTFKRDHLSDIQFNTRLRAAEDTEFLLRYSKHFSYSYIDNVLIVISKHEGERITLNVRETLVSYLEIFRIHREVIFKNTDLRLKYFEKIMTLAYKTGKKKLARKIFRGAFPYSLMQPRIILKFLLFETRSLS